MIEKYFWIGVVYIYLRALHDWLIEASRTKEPFIHLQKKKPNMEIFDRNFKPWSPDVNTYSRNSNGLYEDEEQFIDNYMKQQAIEENTTELEIIEEMKD